MKKIPAPVAVTKKRPITHYIFVVDESGSIANRGLVEAMTKQLHDQARGIIQAAEKENQEVTASLVTFGYPDTRAYTQFVCKGVEELLDYTTHGCNGTPLFDSVAMAIGLMESREQSLKPTDDESFVVIVVTDGCESHSVRWDARALRDFIQSKINTDRWTLAWQLPSFYVDNFINTFGFERGSILAWEQTEAGVERATQATVNSTQGFMASRAAGIRSTRSYYAPNAANLQKTEVKNTLTEISSSCVRALEVDKEIDISAFVVEHKLPFVVGASFYLLTKREKIHAHKELILVPRGEKKYFVGKADARELLGLPPTGEVYVEPGNHGDWLIYVQSTSVNRKLVRGTKLLYRTDVVAGVVPQTWDWKKAHEEAQAKQLMVAKDKTQIIEARVFGAIFAGENTNTGINAILFNIPSKAIDNCLKRLKTRDLVEYTGRAADQGWRIVKGVKLPIDWGLILK